MRRRLPYGITGLSLPGFGVQWQPRETDKRVVKRVVNFLEDRRVLFGDRHSEDERHCLESAQQIRGFLTDRLANDEMSDELAQALKSMRATARAFVDAAGPDATYFTRKGWGGADAYSLALGDLRGRMGLYLGALAAQYGIAVDEDLRDIVPPAPADNDAADWIPGFDT